MATHRPSLRDIAQKAGTSHVTVSLALRDHPKISKQTRLNIQRIAKELGYKPDPMLRALAEYRKTKDKVRYQATLAWINNFPVAEYPDNYSVFQQYQAGAWERAGELGYAIESFAPIADGISLNKLRRILLARGIQGLLVAPNTRANMAWDFDVTGFSALSFGFSQPSPRLHVVTSSQAKSSAVVVAELRKRGYSRIGMAISQNHNNRTAHHFLGGFLAEVCPDMASGDPHPFFIFANNSLDQHQWAEWYGQFRPDAVIVSNTDIARQIESFGVRVPQELGVALLVHNPGLPFWAGIDQNDREIGRVAVDTLASMLHHNETGIPSLQHHILVESTWKDGQSVASRNLSF